MWLWLVEGEPPTKTDMFGAGLAIIGALVIIGLAPRARLAGEPARRRLPLPCWRDSTNLKSAVHLVQRAAPRRGARGLPRPC
jgi:hypothetical protein